MACKCLVTFGDKNVVVPFVGPWKRAQLFEYLKRERAFAGIDFGSATLTVFDADFGLHVDVTDDFTIEDKSKLQIKEGSQYRIVDVIDVEVLPAAPQEPAARRIYTLPSVPVDIRLSIEKHQPGRYFANRRRVVEWLYHDLCTYTMYPGKLYEEAARELITKFPCLADSTGTGYDSWRVQLRFKAKYQRRKLKTQDEAAGSLPVKRTRHTEEVAQKRISRPSLAHDMGDAEDDMSLLMHVESMQKEARKASPDTIYLLDALMRTFAERRKWISEETPSVQNIVEKYPALAVGSVVLQEFKAVTNVTLVDALRGVLDPIAHKILQSAQKKRHLEDFLIGLEKMKDGVPQPEQNDLMLTAAIFVLPSLVKERVEAFVCSREPEAVHVVPTVTYTGNILELPQFTVQLEALEIQAPNLLQAVATQMALYWTFDIVFCAKAQKTFDLLCRLIGVSSGIQATPLVRVAETLLKQ
ncbi:uncharacterized protein LOC142576565 [Dermacentor variabilis]|uniref:uncharacterized protein LOC142576565 n=1 Tax=Dermacentor variabilis TaxID=34621 RepID=UPI003F5AF621